MALPEGFVIDEVEQSALPDGFVVDDGEPAQVAAIPASGDMGEQQKGIGQYAADTVLEAMAAVNRGAVDMADLPATLANAVLQLSGSDKRVPKIGNQDIVRQGTMGQFMEPSLARDVIRAGGEMAAPAPPIIAAGKTAQKALMPADDILRAGLRESTMKMADDLVPPSFPVAVIPGAKNSNEVIEAAKAGGKARNFVMNPAAPEFAEYVLKGTDVAVDPIARQAVKQGLDRGLVSMVKTASKETRGKMAAMLSVVKKGKADLRYQDRFRPWDVAGKSMEDRIGFIVKTNKQAGKEVNEAAKALKGEFVNYTPAVDTFIDDLGEYGVILSRNEDGKIVPEFNGSNFRGMAKPQKIIKELVNYLDTDNPVDARQVHLAKKYIDELVNWGKNASGSAGQVEGIAKKLRGNLNGILGDAFPTYKAANTKYSETINVLDDFAKASGSKLSPSDDGYFQAVGTGLRRLLSNAQSKSSLTKTVDDLETISSRYGASFTDDIRDQVSFANQLDALFGPAAKTSLAGEVGKVGEKIADVAVGQKTTQGALSEGASSLYKKLTGVNEDNTMRALEELVRTNYVTP